jgi:polynucleotide 5'-hydroxyl-kinase GRC3/NOL9
LSANTSVSLVDSDVGQSSLGLPGTISMKLFNALREAEHLRWERMFFVGTVNPAKRIPLIIDGTRRMADRCRRKSDVTLIDTSGLVAGEIGKTLKTRKIKAVNPDRIIALQRADELEHILGAIEDVLVERINVSPLARVRRRGERIRYRQEKLRHYFDETRLNEFLLERKAVRFFDGVRELGPREELGRGSIIGLNHGEDTVALGIVEEMSGDKIIFNATVKGLKKINKVVCGDMALH